MKKILIICSIFFIFTINVSARILESKPVYNSKNGHSYWRVDTPMKWSEAKKYCENKNAYLVSINDADEQEFVYNQVILNESIVPYKIKVHHDYAIGGSDKEQEGIWVWTDGSFVTYENWEDGFPSTDYSDNNFMYLNYSNGMWYNYLNYDTFPFVCEYDGKLKGAVEPFSNTGTDIEKEEHNENDYNRGFEDGKKYCKDNPEECGIEVSKSCNYEYEKGYEEGKKYCKDNPDKCGISCDSRETNCSSNGTILPNSEVECGYYNFMTSSLHVPCIEIGADKYWFDFKVVTDKYSKVYLTIGDFGKTYSEVDCSKFNEDECKKYNKICEWEPGLFGLEGHCKKIDSNE